MYLFLAAALLTVIPQAQNSEPNRQPQLVTSPGLTALVFGSGSSIWIAMSNNNGQTFAPATQIATVPALALGRHRGPRAVISGHTVLVTAVSGNTVASGNLLAWRSTDAGHSWSKPVIINDVPGAAREGLHAMALDDAGEVAAVWLDLRSPGTKLYGAYSKDHGLTWSTNRLVYQSQETTICQCCDPSLVSSSRPHEFDVMFRNVVQGSRDMYWAKWNLDSEIAAPEKLGTGSWNINACPMDGGGIARRGDKLFTAWRRDKTVYLDEANQPENPIGEGKDVALALPPQGPYVAWTNSSGVQIHRPGDAKPLCLSDKGAYPALLSIAGGSVLAAWEQEGQIHLQILK